MRMAVAAVLLASVGVLRAQELSPSDWSSIRAAWDAGRHAAFAVEGGHRARNPGQRWATDFDGRGFTTTPDAGGWTWGLQLEGYGWGEVEARGGAPRVTARGQHVSYDWDERLSEWYVNDVTGLEHGFTVASRPAGVTGELVLMLAVRGGLRPVVEGRDVRFVDERGVAVVDYAGLTVTDADGRVLAAGFTAGPGGLRLEVRDAHARYPLSIDPTAQQAFLKGSNTQADDGLGNRVAVDGDTVVVAAHTEDSGATGVNGDQSDNSAPSSGAAYVFVRDGATWSQQAYLKASNTDSGDFFGLGLAISGDTIVVGASLEDSPATGVNGAQGNGLSDSGAAYVFVRNGTTWSQQAYLKASNPDTNDLFGQCAISGDTIVIGAGGEDSGASGVDGDQSDNSAGASGAAYVFVRAGTTWSQQAYLKASNSGPLDSFGSVAISGDTIVVGAGGESSSATGVDGDQTDNSASNAGAAYVFVRAGTTWSQQAYLKALDTNANDRFGGSVTVWDDTVVIGATGEDSAATGVNGNFGDESAPSSGAAYVFVRTGAAWSQQAYLKPSNTDVTDAFGFGVAIWDDTVVVGAIGEDSSATGVNGDDDDETFFDSGAAYVFVRSGSSWSQQAYLKASNTGTGDNFGFAVAISAGTVAVGATLEDGPDNSTPNAGAGYLFALDLPWTDLGFALPGSNGTPALSGLGPLTAGSLNQIDLVGAKPSATATLIFGLSQLGAPFKGGVLVPNPQLFIPLPTSPAGTLKLPFNWPSGVPAGLPLYFQFWIADPGAGSGFAASNGLKGVSG